MSEQKSGIEINGVIATKALESLRKFAASPRERKTKVERDYGAILHLIIELEDKEEYKLGKEVLLNLRYPLDNENDNYEIVFVTRGGAAKMQGKLDAIKHLTTVQFFSWFNLVHVL